MTANSSYSNIERQDIVHLNSQQINLQNTQEKIYNFLLELVNQSSPEEALREFQRLFIDCLESGSLNTVPVIRRMLFVKNEHEFRNTLKRCCYILVNNWAAKRKHVYIQELINLFAQLPTASQRKHNEGIKIYAKWLENFVSSEDYQQLKIFTYKNDQKNKGHWSDRYTTYLLVAQSFDTNNLKEQQEAASKLSRQMKDKFKLELAMYIARSQSATSSVTRYTNPSILGDNVLHLIKKIVTKKGKFSHENLANIFLKQTQNLTLQEFKLSLQKYLFFAVANQEIVKVLEQQLADKLSSWKVERNAAIINNHLLLRCCNRLIDCLTTENRYEPSSLFILLLSRGNPLTLVILLLKIILICRNSRSHLEIRIADLINFYKNYPEDECKWIINFIEVFNITFAIYAENVDYNLINTEDNDSIRNSQANLNMYRVFSQLKRDTLT